ncbi:AfsR/SARP family transcriptional regulator [Amycolatopsis silviterrae]|uniref:BTAD domain-containing putative transcriptional regulator n=1 Tax=Amycolatopsis silviterrae TaxID=1656914 RepID=A0ABW5H7V4_9PSEU
MEFRVLGPVRATDGDRAVPLGGPKPRTLLALLIAAREQAVSVERIVAVLWGAEPNPPAKAAVHRYVSMLRRSLAAHPAGTELIIRDPGGYRLDAPSGKVDLWVFRSRASEGRRALAERRYDDAAALFGEALAQWRGTALGGADGDWAQAECDRLAGERLGVLEDSFEARLAAGQHGGVLDHLVALVAENPLRERLRCHLMVALCLAGQRADALAAYQEGRRVLIGELGVEPSAQLRELHQRVLNGDFGIAPGAEPGAVPTTLVPRQLPPDTADFTGRSAEVSRVLHWITQPPASGLRLCAISGQAGAGKSALAVHVAHQTRFDGGQLYADLRGAQGDPAEVLGRFLRALGVAENAIPAELDARSSLYRTLLADRATLIVLDHAEREDQVRPLLPGGTAGAVLVTSRVRLALEGAEQLDLPAFDRQDALDLLGTLAGPERTRREAETASEIVRLCGFLPLAVRIAGARLAARPAWPLPELARRLRTQRRILSELAIGDLDVRESLARSYAELGERERTALRRLGWLGFTDFFPWLVGVLLGEPPQYADEVVERLVDSRLVEVASGPLRYRLCDLVRAFAYERAEQEEPRSALFAVADRVTNAELTESAPRRRISVTQLSVAP